LATLVNLFEGRYVATRHIVPVIGSTLEVALRLIIEPNGGSESEVAIHDEQML
jgi:hypothetical protein